MDDREDHSRRGFITVLAGAGALVASCTERRADRRESKKRVPDPAEWWEPGGTFEHKSVDTSQLDRGVIRARVDGRWQSFKVAALPDRFTRWSLVERAERLERLAAHGFSMRDLAGPHNACVATYGGPTRDSAVSLNTAYKGMGFVPKRDRLEATLSWITRARARIEKEARGSFMQAIRAKTRVLAELYRDRALFDPTKQISLELFTSPHRPTHTFLNMMSNPIASASFLAYPTFEIRAVPQLLHPKSPKLSSIDRALVAWANGIHDFVHGGAGDRIACVYHVIEVYDDTPKQGGMGRRMV
jgi:hypothetical protein